MISNDEQLKTAQESIKNLEFILERARKVHSPSEYRAMAEPILLELQDRENEIFQYLSVTESEIVGS